MTPKYNCFKHSDSKVSKPYIFRVDEKGIEILVTSVNSVEFEVVTAKGVGAMYIALLKVRT